MKRPNITPGEWHVGTKPGPIVYGPNGEQVTAENLMLPDEENKANARAIAAVPELLEALEHSLAGLESDVLYCERHPDSSQTTQEGMLAHKRQRLAKAKAALVKAGYKF